MASIIDSASFPSTDVLFGSAFTYSSIGMALVGLNGRWLKVNPAICNILGYSETALLEIDFQTLTYPDDLDTDMQHIDQLLRGEISSYEMEKRYIHSNGATIWALLSVSLVRDTDGNPEFFISQVQDITRRKSAEELLLTEQERIRVTLQSIGDGVITTDVKGIITSINPVGEAITGWASQEALGQPVDRVMHLIDEKKRSGITNPLVQSLEQQATVKRDVAILVRRDGAEFAISESASPIHRGDGSLLGGVLVFQDVTEKRKSMNQIKYQATHDQLTQLLNRSEFERTANYLFDDAHANGNEHCLLLLDLDAFKAVNDKGGHMAGDEVLRRIAVLIKSKLRAVDKVARLGGDEFGVWLEKCSLPVATKIAGQLIDAVGSHRMDWQGHTFQVGLCIGIATLSSHSNTLQEVIAKADAACYQAKAAGKNRFQTAR
jgi:diguanylate cyclase (GGDEF)-like protein/PAS domain S-box-containing protein